MTTNTEFTPTEQAIIKAIDAGFTTTRGIVRATPARIDKYAVADTLTRLTNAGAIKWVKRDRHHGNFTVIEKGK